MQKLRERVEVWENCHQWWIAERDRLGAMTWSEIAAARYETACEVVERVGAILADERGKLIRASLSL